jgi:hypothetical protein
MISSNCPSQSAELRMGAGYIYYYYLLGRECGIIVFLHIISLGDWGGFFIAGCISISDIVATASIPY